MAEKNSIPQFVNSESIMSDSNYVKWLSDLKGRIRIANSKRLSKSMKSCTSFIGAWEKTFVTSKSYISGALIL